MSNFSILIDGFQNIRGFFHKAIEAYM